MRPDAAAALQEWKVLAAEHAAGRLPSAATPTAAGRSRPAVRSGRPSESHPGPAALGQPLPGRVARPGRPFPGVFALFVRLRRYGGKFHAAIRAELDQQVQVVCDQGLRPTHLNGHQYIEMIPEVTQVMPELLDRFGIKVVRVAWERSLWQSTVLCGRFWKWPLARVKRAFAARFRARMDALGVAHPDVFFGTVSAGGVDLRLLRRFLAEMGSEKVTGPLCEAPFGPFAKGLSPFPSPPADRLVEIGLHPGEAAEDESPEDRADGWHDPLAAVRPNELECWFPPSCPRFWNPRAGVWVGFLCRVRETHHKSTAGWSPFRTHPTSSTPLHTDGPPMHAIQRGHAAARAG